MALVSVIVPIYNAESYLKRCLDSVLAQTFSDYELILVNDGSSDASGTLCDLYATKDNRIRVLHKANQGQAAARNDGVKIANSEWIAFVDADDTIFPQFLEIMYSAVQQHKLDIAVCRAFEGVSIPNDISIQQQCRTEIRNINENCLKSWLCGLDERISKYVYWTVWGKLIKKSILLEFPFTEGRIYEDNAVVFKWLYRAETIVSCDNVLYFYYVNPEGTTKRSYNLKRLDWLWAVSEQILFYKKIGYAELESMLRKRYIWEALREHDHVNKLLNNRKVARDLRRHIIVYWIKNSKQIVFSYSERMEILSRLFPEKIKRLSALKKYLK